MWRKVMPHFGQKGFSRAKRGPKFLPKFMKQYEAVPQFCQRGVSGTQQEAAHIYSYSPHTILQQRDICLKKRLNKM